MKDRRSWAGIVLVFALSTSTSLAAERIQSTHRHRAIEPFALSQVHLLDGPVGEAMELNRNYLLSLDNDRQLYTFRLTAGLPTKAKPLGGWESPDHFGRGEFFGHYLSACAMLYASTGDEQIKSKLDYLVTELGKCQRALGVSGYLHAEPETYFDKLEKGESVQGIYYTVHKLMAGLLDVHTYCRNSQALQIAEGMARWIKTRSDRLSPAEWEKVLGVEYGGLNEALYNLYAMTGRTTDGLHDARDSRSVVTSGPVL